MALTNSREDTPRHSLTPPGLSHALEWLWQYLAQVRHPRFLECGPVLQSTLDVLLSRGVKLYVTDLLTPLQQNDALFWSREGKKPVFLSEDFLAQLQAIPPESISAICCWGLLDLLPHEVLSSLLERFHSCLTPGGVLFCILREPHLGAGADARWWFESLTVLGSGNGKQKPYAYPAVTNREMERLFPGGNIKTFLTRSGRREVLGIK